MSSEENDSWPEPWYLIVVPAWVAWTLFFVLGLVAIALTRRLDDRDR